MNSEQLSLFTIPSSSPSPSRVIYDPYWDEIDTPVAPNPYDCVGEQVTSDTKKTAHQHDKQNHWVEKYWVERAGNKYWYFRYTWMTGRKLNRLYLGSATSAIAKNRKSEIEAAINDGQTPDEIQQLIRSWRHQKQPNL